MLISRRKVRFLKANGQLLVHSNLRVDERPKGQPCECITMEDTPEDKQFSSFEDIPSHLQVWPLVRDSMRGPTAELQDQTIEECLPLLQAIKDSASNPFDFDVDGFHILNKEAHITFIWDGLEHLPAQFVAMDASRPWLMYWSLMSLYILGEDVQSLSER